LPGQIADLVRVASAPGVSVLQVLLDRGVPCGTAVVAASFVTGVPPAPRLLLRNPQVPAEVDAVGARDAGGVPIGRVQGRLWVAFVNPEAAKASVFSDDVVVCLALDADLRAARARFDAAHPPAGAGDTQAMSAVTPALIEAFKRQHGEKPTATRCVAARVTLSDDAMADEDMLFDQPTKDGQRAPTPPRKRAGQAGGADGALPD
jgi:hypothetical protein